VVDQAVQGATGVVDGVMGIFGGGKRPEIPPVRPEIPPVPEKNPEPAIIPPKDP
jgi:hypothetical protein